MTREPNLIQVAFDLAPAGMLVIAAGGEVVLANREAERIFGYEPGTLAGVSADRLVPAALRSGHAALRAGFSAAPHARPMGAGRELAGVRRDGSEFPVEVGLTPFGAGVDAVVIASVADISARRAAEREELETQERLRRTQKLEALGTLAGGIAHDFNNVLMGIVGYTELAQRQVREHPTVGEDLEHVLRAAERGRQLVGRILAYTGRREAALTRLDLERVVHEATGLLRASLPATVEMRVIVEPGLPPVLAEEAMLHQVILNLGTNASHAMEQAGTLQVTVLRDEAEASLLAAHPSLAGKRLLRLSVTDNGCGMTPDVIARVYEPFFTTKPAGEGSGLGLSTVHSIVESLGGAIDILSSPGRGTKVHVWLPVLEAGTATPETATPAAPLGAPVRQPHVLLVEDEPALAAMERRQLQALGCRVTVHTSSPEALEDFRLRPETYDLVITDNLMPRLTGLMLARQLAALRPGLPILMVSGNADPSDLPLLEANGVTRVLRKPHSLQELDEALRSLLDL